MTTEKKNSRRTWKAGRCLENSAANTAERFVRTQVFYSKPFEEFVSVLQVSVLGPFIYDVLIKDLCSFMKHSKYFSFFDIKIVGTLSSATDCTLLQSDIDSIRG